METITILINPDGLTAKKGNPYTKEVANWDSENYRMYMKFEFNNPSYPLTEPGEPGAEVNAELVKQWQSIYGGWETLEFGETIEDYTKNGFKIRIAWQVVSNKEETPEKLKSIGEILIENFGKDIPPILWEIGSAIPTEADIEWAKNKIKEYGLNPPQAVTEQSIEEVAENYINATNADKIDRPRYRAFIAGCNHILSSKGLVDREAVIEILVAKIALEQKDKGTAQRRLNRQNSDIHKASFVIHIAECDLIISELTNLINKIKEI